MKHTWIIVANSTSARIFSAENNHHLKEIAILEHPEGRLHARDLVSDRSGRSFESSSTVRHAMEPQTSPKKVEFALFAKDLAKHLEEAKHKGLFDKLYIAANPAFLGTLRQAFMNSTAQAIAGEINKDITHLTAEEIRKHFPFVL